MTAELLCEAAGYLETFVDADERARELTYRLRLAAKGVRELWPKSCEEVIVEWHDEDGAAVVAVCGQADWELARFAPCEHEPRGGDHVDSLADAARFACEWLG